MNNIILSFLSNFFVYVSNYYFDLIYKISNTECICKSDENKKRFGLLLKKLWIEN